MTEETCLPSARASSAVAASLKSAAPRSARFLRIASMRLSADRSRCSRAASMVRVTLSSRSTSSLIAATPPRAANGVVLITLVKRRELDDAPNDLAPGSEGACSLRRRRPNVSAERSRPHNGRRARLELTYRYDDLLSGMVSARPCGPRFEAQNYGSDGLRIPPPVSGITHWNASDS
jgi:hypothetical protein